MHLDEEKYNQLFINKFHANSLDLKNEFERVTKEFGYSEEIKLEFYSEVFEKIITQCKNELPKNEHYFDTITSLYQLFIAELKKDKIDSNKFQEDLKKFREQLPSQQTSKPTRQTQKQYNPNTKYGRRKARQQAQEHYNSLPIEEKREYNFVAIVILIVVCLFMWLILGTDGFLKWASH